MFKIDLHVHTHLGGDSSIEPFQLVAKAREVGLDAVCITEHHSYDLSRPFEQISRETGFPILRGMEYRAAEGHLLIYGLSVGKSDLMPGLPMQHVINWVNRRKGVAIPAHPYQAGSAGGCLGDGVLRLTGLVAVETPNGSARPVENLRAAKAARRMQLKATGGSDAHGIAVLGRAYTVFDKPVVSDSALAAALRSQHYIAYPRMN